jgi:hypothetical protein
MNTAKLVICAAVLCGTSVSAMAGRVVSSVLASAPSPVSGTSVQNSGGPSWLAGSDELTQSAQLPEPTPLEFLATTPAPTMPAITRLGSRNAPKFNPVSPDQIHTAPRVNDPADSTLLVAVVPLPAGAWMGLSLLGAVGVAGLIRKNRVADVA